MATNIRVSGQRVGFDEQGNLTINDRPPELTDLGDGLFRVTAYFFRYVKPVAVVGARKRKQALKASAKKYRLSFEIKKEM